MRRGDIVTVAETGDYGKPRPAVIIQSDLLNRDDRSTIVALITSHLQDAPLLRLTLKPTEHNGLRAPSQVKINRLVSLPCKRIGSLIGRLSDQETIELNRLLAVVIGLA